MAFRFRAHLGKGPVEGRLQEGKRRLACLETMPRSLSNKMSLLQLAIWPATFYGLESFVLPIATVEQLRSRAATALLGRRNAKSPYLTLSVLAEHTLDPEPVLLLRALRCLARALTVEPLLGQQWLHATLQALQQETTAIGPATALATMLRRCQWSLLPTGWAKGPGHWTFHVTQSGDAQMVAAVEGAWRALLPERIRHRNGLHQVEVPDAASTAKALSRFGRGEQLLLALSITGAFLSPAAVSQWDPLQDPRCPFCGAACTKHHQLLECPATAALRSNHVSVLQWMQERAPHWVHACFGTEHPLEPFLRLVWQSRRLQPAPDIQHVVEAVGLTQLRFYTDGSCSSPACPPASHAGWAVVLDLCPHEPPASLRQTWMRLKQPPSRFAVVARGLVPGPQLIHRAEVCAALQAVQMASRHPHLPAYVGVDSASALRVVSRAVQGTLQPRVAHSDLLQHVPSGATRPTLYKVKAHQGPDEVDDAQLTEVLGNKGADMAAAAARGADFDNIRQDAASVARWRQEQDARLHAYYCYLVQLARQVAPLKRGLEVDRQREAAVEEQYLPPPGWR